MSDIKVGDRVRATCKEYVVDGTVTDVYGDGLGVKADKNEPRYLRSLSCGHPAMVFAP